MIKKISKIEEVKIDRIVSVVCDVCKTEYDQIDDIMEVQEFTHIRDVGGYNSVFGDETKFELDICQHCLKDKLGEFIRIKNE